MKIGRVIFFLGIVLIGFSPWVGASGQRGRGGAPQAQSPRASAPFDMTGYWVSMVTEDWRYRMFTPPKGDYSGIPLNAEGRRIADTWDPSKDEAAGEQCRSYGAGNIMRVPERLHITWQNDQTLKLETDAGNQTRLFYFGIPNGQGGDWQGISKASWDSDAGFGLPAQQFDRQFGEFGKPSGGSLKVVTTRLKPGYLRKNGVPYSANAVMVEYYDRVTEPNGCRTKSSLQSRRLVTSRSSLSSIRASIPTIQAEMRSSMRLVPTRKRTAAISEYSVMPVSAQRSFPTSTSSTA